MNKEITDILKKDGRDWTKEEGKIIQAAIKKHGRAALKKERAKLR